MKIDTINNIIFINLQTEFAAGSAINQFTGDSLTEVYFGSLYARVTMFDLRISIEMDSVPGDWKNPEWARNYALTALAKSFKDSSPADIGLFIKQLFTSARELGHNEGVEQNQLDMRKALGL